MTPSTLKKRIHQALDNTSDNEILQVVYTILTRTIIEQDVTTSLTAAQKKDFVRINIAESRNDLLVEQKIADAALGLSSKAQQIGGV